MFKVIATTAALAVAATSAAAWEQAEIDAMDYIVTSTADANAYGMDMGFMLWVDENCEHLNLADRENIMNTHDYNAGTEFGSAFIDGVISGEKLAKGWALSAGSVDLFCQAVGYQLVAEGRGDLFK
jgi:hypothetical protein